MSRPDDAADGFLGRWSRRKALVREGVPVPAVAPTPEVPAVQAVPEAAAITVAPVVATDVTPQPPEPPPPTLEDVAQLDLTSDFRRFVQRDVAPEVKNAALKKLFTDPQFNLMDGLDTYIDDYGKADPIPASMLRQMVQSKFLGLFDDEENEARKLAAAGATPDGAVPDCAAQSPSEPMLPIADDQDPAVRLQPLDAAGSPCDPGRAGEDPGREH